MKKIRALALLLLLCTAFLFVFGACNEAVCQHRDVNDDGVCDKCDEEYTDGVDVVAPCQHRDANDDSLCDLCNESYTDGLDVTGSCRHYDGDGDELCDVCGASYTGGTGNGNTGNGNQTVTPGNGSSFGKYTVGIVQLVTHPALDAATEGFKQALIDELGEENVTFDVQNAGGDAAMCKTITDNFASTNVDLIMANATPALQAAVKSTKTIPILGTSVTEYGVALEIENFSGTVGGNVSGTSDLAPLTAQADMILEIVPNAKKVGLLYCAAEANSLYQVSVVKSYLEAKGITCEEYTFNDTNDVSNVASLAASENDALYIPTDNTAASCAPAIYSAMGNNKKPVIAGEAGICSGCGVATLSIDYGNLGYTTGLMAAKILKGEKNISEMPIENDPAPVKQYNAQICKALGIDAAALEAAGYTVIEGTEAN